MRILMMLLAAGLSVGALAQDEAAPSAEPPAKKYEAPDGFENVEGAGDAQADIEASPLVVGAYLIIWALTFGYLVLLWIRQGRVHRDIESLTRRLEEAAKD